ncbi:MAG: pyruvate kinase alpha/beta domain-containing protein, partial [Pseudonocardiaceae bacterium]
VYPIPFEQRLTDPEKLLDDAEDELRRHKAVKDGDHIIMTIGEPLGKAGGTNTMKIVKVGEHRQH